MNRTTKKAGTLGLGVAIALIVSMSSAGALADHDASVGRPTPRGTQSIAAAVVSQGHMPVCAWRHCAG